MNSLIKLVSVNIEIDRHLDVVEAFLAKEQPDVACIQELPVSEVERVGKSLNAQHYVYAPMTKWKDPHVIIGNCIFSKFPFISQKTDYYRGSGDSIQDLDYTSVEASNRTKSLSVISVEIEKDGMTYALATTHFTWTPDGEVDDYQREDLKKMLAIPALSKEIVFVGDFNAPRGGEIFTALSSRFKDNIPSEYTTSIDGNLHRRGQLNKMVDGLFTTPGYVVSNVRLEFGVSDHAALIAEVSNRAL